MIELRRAVPADAAAVAAFGEAAFRAAFGAANEPADVEAHAARVYAVEAVRAELGASDLVCLLAVVDGGIAGSALLAPGSAPAGVELDAPAEIRRFYVGAPHHGRGVAQALMAGAADAARAAGARTLWLTTWERAAQARRFYAKSGFRDVGSVEFILGHSVQTDRLLVRPLA
ncbi:MAG: GNAT family N-acetyltransferase [Proteobacteria bacterium]|nr:GNAT family N-acetyltransferase [Pseudomonadota bacterium]